MANDVEERGAFFCQRRGMRYPSEVSEGYFVVDKMCPLAVPLSHKSQKLCEMGVNEQAGKP